MTTLHDIKQAGEFKCNIARLNIMCKHIARRPSKVYEIAKEYGTPFVVDSYMRETIFQYIADKYHNGDYSKVYNAWLKAA